MNDYQERRKRDRRVQYPPMSYWQQYETEEEEAFCRSVTELADKLMKPFLYVAAVGLIVLLTVNGKLYWLPPIVAVLTVVWWVGWGRKRYE